MVETKKYQKGEIIFKAGSYEPCLYVIESGTVGVYRKWGAPGESLLTELGAGRFFGEIGMIDARPRSADAVAASDAEIKKIDRDSFREYFINEPKQMLELFASVSARLKELSAEYAEQKDLLAQYKASTKETRGGLLDKIRAFLTPGAGQDVPRAVREAAKRDAGYIEVKKGAVICREGAEENWMYLINQGSVALYSGYETDAQKQLGTLEDGDSFGEIAMLEHTARTATAVALENCVLEIIPEDTFFSYFEGKSAKVVRILENAIARVRELANDVEIGRAELKRCTEAE